LPRFEAAKRLLYPGTFRDQAKIPTELVCAYFIDTHHDELFGT